MRRLVRARFLAKRVTTGCDEAPRLGATTGDEVLRALQLSDRWAAAVQRATRPLAKPVQIIGVLGSRAAANANRHPAPITRGHGARGAA